VILHKKGVPNIAECLNSGDIGNGTYHSTQTHLFVDVDWVTSPKPAAEFTPHRHYRIVLDTIGTPLERFKCSRDMVRTIRASLIGEFFGSRNICFTLMDDVLCLLSYLVFTRFAYASYLPYLYNQTVSTVYRTHFGLCRYLDT
jgi:hypothetical protein